MTFSARDLAHCSVVVSALALAACSGGGSMSAPFGAPTTAAPVAVAGAGISISPAYAFFQNPTASAQTVTLRLTGSNTAPPTSSLTCGIATIVQTGNPSPGAYTYSVTPTAQSGCDVIFTSGTQQAALAIGIGTSGGWGGLQKPANPTVALTTGQTSSFTIAMSASAGNPNDFGVNSAACNGIATVTPPGSSGNSQTYTVTGVAPGVCSVSVVQQAAVYEEDIVVSAPGSAPAVAFSPPAVSFTTTTATSQTVAITVGPSAGPVTVDQSACTTSGATIATMSLNGSTAATSMIAQSATATISAYGSSTAGGSCQIVFTPAHGSAAILLVTVAPGVFVS